MRDEIFIRYQKFTFDKSTNIIRFRSYRIATFTKSAPTELGSNYKLLSIVARVASYTYRLDIYFDHMVFIWNETIEDYVFCIENMACGSIEILASSQVNFQYAI